MKIVFTAESPEYSRYAFPYTVHAHMDRDEDFSPAYEQGFLPYSANPNEKSIRFYKCRSLRVDATRFVDSSENRRTDRKLDGTSIDLDVIPIEKIRENPHFTSFAKEYITARFEPGTMNDERLHFILAHPCATHVWHYHRDGEALGYVLCWMNENSLHYWFAFYTLSLPSDLPIGKWIMWATIRKAVDAGLEHIYLGTSYGTKSLYKIRDHKGLAWHDGNEWSEDIKQLKELCKKD